MTGRSTGNDVQPQTGVAPHNEFGHLALLKAAAVAPSGDNTQPWRFEVETSRIRVIVDPARDPSPMNAGQRMARIAAGAAAENIIACQRHNGGEARCPTSDDESSITVEVEGHASRDLAIPRALVDRVTNRRIYRGGNIEPSELSRLVTATSALNKVHAVWVTSAEKLNAVAAIIAQADALMFGIGPVRRAFLENVRFDRPPNEAVDEGLSLGSLELGFADHLGLRLLGAVPDRLFGVLGMARALRRKAEALIRSSMGVCLIVAEGDQPAVDFEVGRRTQQAWLTLTASNFAVQPMMSLPVLDNIRGAHDSLLCRSDNADCIAALRDDLRTMAGISEASRIAAILRFGRAPAPTARTGRRPLASVLSING